MVEDKSYINQTWKNPWAAWAVLVDIFFQIVDIFENIHS